MSGFGLFLYRHELPRVAVLPAASAGKGSVRLRIEHFKRFVRRGKTGSTQFLAALSKHPRKIVIETRSDNSQRCYYVLPHGRRQRCSDSGQYAPLTARCQQVSAGFRFVRVFAKCRTKSLKCLFFPPPNKPVAVFARQTNRSNQRRQNLQVRCSARPFCKQKPPGTGRLAQNTDN